MRGRLLPTVVALTAAGLLLLATGGGSSGMVSTSGQPVRGDEEAGRDLYVTGCASCHGLEGRGVVVDGRQRGPSLQQSGEAMAYYQLATGRMPLADSGDVAERKPAPYAPEEIADLVAYVASFSEGQGPALPSIDVDRGDLAAGGEIFRANCAACHGAAGTGGALSYGRSAPNIHAAQPAEIGAAVRAGPGQMPVFGEETVSDAELDSLTRYVEYLDDPEDPGGLPLARVGPIPEGFVSWIIGFGFLLVCVLWLGTRMRRARDETP